MNKYKIVIYIIKAIKYLRRKEVKYPTICPHCNKVITNK